MLPAASTNNAHIFEIDCDFISLDCLVRRTCVRVSKSTCKSQRPEAWAPILITAPKGIYAICLLVFPFLLSHIWFPYPQLMRTKYVEIILLSLSILLRYPCYLINTSTLCFCAFLIYVIWSLQMERVHISRTNQYSEIPQ